MKRRVILTILACMLIAFTSCKTNINGEIPKKTYTVKFSAVGEGNITATINETKIDSNANVEEGTTVDFVVLFDEKEYKVEKWVKAEENTFNKSRAKLVVSEDVEVKVIITNREPVRVTLNLIATENGKIEARIGEKELHSGDKIIKDSVINFKAIPDDGYEVSSWNGAKPSNADNTCATAEAKADLNVSVIFSPIPPQDVMITEVKIKDRKADIWLNSVVIEADEITKDDVKVMGKIAGKAPVELEIEKLEPETHTITTAGTHVKITTKESQKYKSATISILVVKYRPDKKYIQIASVSVKDTNVELETRTVFVKEKEDITKADIKLTIIKEDGSTEVVEPASITPSSVVPSDEENGGKGANCRIVYYYDGLSYIVNIFIKHLTITDQKFL